MPPAATETVASDTAKSETPAPYLSTMPDNDFGWQITLAQKVVVITGVNRGIGLGIAEVCLANSAKMVYSFDLMEPGEDFAALQKRYPNFHFIQTDATSEESVEKSINLVIEETGGIDGLVANAGMTKHQPALKFDRPELEKLFNLNVIPTDGFFPMTCFSHIASGLWRLFLYSDRRSQVHRARHQGLYRYDI
jgi:NAD(P)-dependent dehydrogenase (short-subunit alcohol dehydrogenase family)